VMVIVSMLPMSKTNDTGNTPHIRAVNNDRKKPAQGLRELIASDYSLLRTLHLLI